MRIELIEALKQDLGVKKKELLEALGVQVPVSNVSNFLPRACGEDLETGEQHLYELCRTNDLFLRLGEVCRTLARIECNPEGFGVCEKCEQEIEAERLKILPATTFCCRCAAIVEARRRRWR